MHRSRLGTIVIDCQTERLDEAAGFWAAAFGREARRPDDPADGNYRDLKGPSREANMLVQAVAHPNRVHIDIETDDIDAEVAHLESIGARLVEYVKRWWVMAAPTGQRFCVVRPQRADFNEHANVWGNASADGKVESSAPPTLNQSR